MESFIHRQHTCSKIITIFFFVVLIVSTPPRHLLTFIIYAGLLFWTIALARIPLGPILKRAAIVLPFSLLAAAALPFIHGNQSVVVWGMQLSEPGLWKLFSITVKSLLAAIASILLIATTPFSNLLGGLRSLGLPTLFIDLLALSYRYFHVLIEETTRLHRAAIARGYSPQWLAQAVIIGRLIGNLFVRSYERSERIYAAMRLRGYNGTLPHSAAPYFHSTDFIRLTAMLLLLLSIRLFIL